MREREKCNEGNFFTAGISQQFIFILLANSEENDPNYMYKKKQRIELKTMPHDRKTTKNPMNMEQGIRVY